MNTPHLMNAYPRTETTFVRGAGVRLWDDQGREYLDALGGIAVCGLGHAHPRVTQTICEQASTLTHISNLFNSKQRQTLADKLCTLAAMDNVFFTNSGAEANEAALKIARKFGHQKDIDIPHIIVMENSFHGRTLGTLSASGSKKVREWFEPMVQGFIRINYNDIDAVKKIAAENNKVVAILVEPIQGEGGINIPAEDYLPQLRKICDDNDWLLMLDEIQCGMGRTGKFLASHQYNIHGDVVTMAKSLGNGFPIGACLAKGKAAEVIQPGNHGSTYGGNPLACATALSVIDTIVEENLMQNAHRIGTLICEKLTSNLSKLGVLNEVRHQGLMIGVELNEPCGDIVSLSLEEGLVVNVTAGNVIRLLPPFIYTEADAEELVSKLTAAVQKFAASKQ